MTALRSYAGLMQRYRSTGWSHTVKQQLSSVTRGSFRVHFDPERRVAIITQFIIYCMLHAAVELLLRLSASSSIPRCFPTYFTTAVADIIIDHVRLLSHSITKQPILKTVVRTSSGVFGGGGIGGWPPFDRTGRCFCFEKHWWVIAER